VCLTLAKLILLNRTNSQGILFSSVFSRNSTVPLKVSLILLRPLSNEKSAWNFYTQNFCQPIWLFPQDFKHVNEFLVTPRFADFCISHYVCNYSGIQLIALTFAKNEQYSLHDIAYRFIDRSVQNFPDFQDLHYEINCLHNKALYLIFITFKISDCKKHYLAASVYYFITIKRKLNVHNKFNVLEFWVTITN
jgi:hypothetical protein